MKVCERLRFLVLGFVLFGVCVVSLPAAEEVGAAEGSQVAIGVETEGAVGALTEEQIAERVSQQVLAEFQKVVEQQNMAVKGHDGELKIKLLKEQVAAYKETIEYQKDSLTKIFTVVGFLIVVAGFFIWRQSQAYNAAIEQARLASKDAKAEVREAVTQMKTESKDAVSLAREIGKEAITEVKQAVREMKEETKEALALARETGREARDACEKAQDWERKTQEVFDRVNAAGNEKVAKIDERVEKAEDAAAKAVEEIDDIINISRLWNDSIQAANRKEYEKACEICEQITKESPDDYYAFNNLGIVLIKWGDMLEGKAREDKYAKACEKFAKAVEIRSDQYEVFSSWGIAITQWAYLLENSAKESKYSEACEKYAKAVEIKPDCHDVFSNWGIVLGDWAKLLKGEAMDSKYGEACEKYAKAVEIKPDYFTAFDNWGAALLFWAVKVEEPKRTKLLDEAIEKCEKAESIKKGEGAYNMACVYACKDDEGNCRKWLGVGEAAGTLQTLEHASKDEDLKAYWGEDWFKEIRWGK